MTNAVERAINKRVATFVIYHEITQRTNQRVMRKVDQMILRIERVVEPQALVISQSVRVDASR